MSQKYPGGIISKTAPVTVGPVDGEGGSAPGVWTLEQALALQKQGLWPKPVLPKELYAWGANGEGELGLNDTNNRSSPVQVGALTDWSNLASGGANGFSLGTKADGTLWAWGYNSSGQLGLNNTANRSSPVQVGALTAWSKVAAGGKHCLAVKTDGTLWAWGYNGYGQLGTNNIVNRSSPVQIGALTAWYEVAATRSASIAMKTDGTLWAWGRAGSGELGLNDTANRSSPVQVGSLTNWAHVSGGQHQFLARKTDGTIWGWGDNYQGRLGLNDTVDRSSPVQIGSLTEWSQVSAGYQHSLAVKTNGTLWVWGNSGNGRLGLGVYATDKSSPVQVGALTTWNIVSGQNSTSFAIKTDGTLWVWGLGNTGQTGLGNTVQRFSPIQVGAQTNWLKLPKAGLVQFSLVTKSP